MDNDVVIPVTQIEKIETAERGIYLQNLFSRERVFLEGEVITLKDSTRFIVASKWIKTEDFSGNTVFDKISYFNILNKQKEKAKDYAIYFYIILALIFSILASMMMFSEQLFKFMGWPE
jgi:hypothetical protein